MGVTYTERVALLDGSFLVVAVVVAVVLARHHWSGDGRDVMTLMLKAIERKNKTFTEIITVSHCCSLHTKACQIRTDIKAKIRWPKKRKEHTTSRYCLNCFFYQLH